MTPREFVQRLEALATAVDDAGAITFAEQHYAAVAAQLTGDERRVVGSIMHAARMAVAMKQSSRAVSPPPAALAP